MLIFLVWEISLFSFYSIYNSLYTHGCLPPRQSPSLSFIWRHSKFRHLVCVRLAFSMLCSVCDRFDIRASFLDYMNSGDSRQSQPYEHHRGFVDLFTAVNQGCNLCAVLWKACSGRQSVNLRSQGNRPADQLYLEVGSSSASKSYLSLVRKNGDSWSRLVSLEIYAVHDHVPPECPESFRGTTCESGEPEGYLRLAAHWLRDCQSSHEGCRQFQRPKKLPSRVLDLNALNDDVRLCQTDGTEGNWVALSYCWGGKSSYMLRKVCLEDWVGHMSLNDFPQTLRDAVLITRRLGLRYLWIDALCIIQDDPDDWTQEASQMAYIYQNATISIAAADSPAARHGILKFHDVTDMECQLDWKTPESEKLYRVALSRDATWNTSIKNCPLDSRGWTLQEAILSPRILLFAADCIAWECPEQCFDDHGREWPAYRPSLSYRDKYLICGLTQAPVVFNQSNLFRRLAEKAYYHTAKTVYDVANRLPPDLQTLFAVLTEHSGTSGGLLMKGDLFGLPDHAASRDLAEKHSQFRHQWREISSEYTKRHLTVPSDMLPALSGLARTFKDVLGEEYLAGLFGGKRLLNDLAWVRMAGSTSEVVTDVPPSTPGYRVPSWSWASIRGGRVYYLDAQPETPWRLDKSLRVLSTRVQALGPDPFGQTAGGCIELRAPFELIPTPVALETTSRTAGNIILEPLQKRAAQSKDFWAELRQQHLEVAGQKFAALLWSDKYEVWILMIVESTGNAEDEYRRIGLLEYHPGSDLTAGESKALRALAWKRRRIRLV